MTIVKFETEQKHVFMYSKLEKFLKDEYGIEVKILEDMIPDNLVGHYTYHEFTVDGESELDTVGDDEIVFKWILTGQLKNLDMTDVEDYWADTADVEVKHILHRMFANGQIESGKYLMQVDW